jgi:hypothetical protein
MHALVIAFIQSHNRFVLVSVHLIKFVKYMYVQLILVWCMYVWRHSLSVWCVSVQFPCRIQVTGIVISLLSVSTSQPVTKHKLVIRAHNAWARTSEFLKVKDYGLQWIQYDKYQLFFIVHVQNYYCSENFYFLYLSILDFRVPNWFWKTHVAFIWEVNNSWKPAKNKNK